MHRPLPIHIPQKVLTILKARLVASYHHSVLKKAIWMVHLTLAQDRLGAQEGCACKKFAATLTFCPCPLINDHCFYQVRVKGAKFVNDFRNEGDPSHVSL